MVPTTDESLCKDALDYLDSLQKSITTLGALRMSMGATKAWWLAALDPCVRLCLDVRSGLGCGNQWERES